MAVGDDSGSNIELISNLDAGNPLYLQNNDNSSISLVNVKLVGAENYKMWATAVKIALKGKNKMGFIDGTCIKPIASTVMSQQWERCNAIVLGWILGSLSQELYVGQIYSEIASDVWTELKETYDKMDGSVVFNLMQRINNLKQDDLSVPDYYHKLNSLWREFDILTILPACVCENRPACCCENKTASAKHNQLIRLMQFLMGLNDVYQPIRSTILAKDPLPNVKDAFYVVSREESHRGLHPSNTASNKAQPAAFIARTNNNNFNNSNRRPNNTNLVNRGPNPNLLCKHCNMIGHTIEKCYELVGYPPGYKRNPILNRQPSSSYNRRFNANSEVREYAPSTSGSNAPSTSGSLTGSFTSDQMMKLLSLINDKPSPAANMSGIKPTFYNNNVFFDMHIDKFFCAKSNCDMFNITLGWIIDSGANQHMTVSTCNMFDVIDISCLNLTVGHPNGTVAKISSVGSLRLSGGIVLFDVLVVPEYNVSLLSVNKMVKDSKLFVGFDESKCYIQDLNLEKIVGTGSEFGGLYLFDDKIGKNVDVNCNSVFVCHASCELWHCRLGHPADPVMTILGKHLGFSKTNHLSPCDICHKAKQVREPFPLSDHKTTSVGDIIHCDVWGPYRVTSKDGYKFFLTLVDDFSRAVWVYMLKSKTEVGDYIESFLKLILTQFSKKVKVVRSDNGTEFVNNHLTSLFSNLGIIHQTSCAYTPQQNGIAERKHRHLLNVARSLMFQGGIPLYMWPECVLTAVYLINRLPSSVLSGVSPYFIVYGKNPSLSHIRSFGCLCYSTVLNSNDKFCARSEKCVLIGFSTTKKAYKLYSLENKNVFYSRDVKFYETVFPFKMKTKNSLNSGSKNAFGVSKSELQSLSFFDIQRPKSPYDEEGDTSNGEGNTRVASDGCINTAEDEVASDATQIGENVTSEGNTSQNQNGEGLSNVLGTSSPELRRSTRQKTMPVRFNDFVVNSSVRYGLEKYVCYANLSKSNLCFSTSLNKLSEPKSFSRSYHNPKWVEALNLECEAYLGNKNL
ncbi:putative RNA-directed DNA polymerase [Tanacetum coccineum]